MIGDRAALTAMVAGLLDAADTLDPNSGNTQVGPIVDRADEIIEEAIRRHPADQTTPEPS